MKKPKLISHHERIRKVQKAFDYWMSKRQVNFLHGQTTEQMIAESEAMRLGALLSDLKREQEARLKAIEKAFHPDT